MLPDQTKCFQLDTDASAYAIGAVLFQLCDNGKWRSVGFVSKCLSETECNYAIHDKELLSVIHGLEEWQHILEGTKCCKILKILSISFIFNYKIADKNLNKIP